MSVALFCVVSFLTPKDTPNKRPNDNQTVQEHTQSKASNLTHDHQHEHVETEESTTLRKPSNTSPKIQFSYKNEVRKVQKLSENFPESKDKLLTLINNADPFKKDGRSVRPHTSDELTQRKIGAVKILALKALIEKETQKDILKRDLVNISRNALDPTITQIAKAALESEEQGRSLFDDFNEAIPVQMPE